jgi:hypothetical protein
MSTEGNGVYYSCCDCEDVCECTVVTPEPEMETDDSPFPDYITNYVLSRKPIITLYNVDEDDEYNFNKYNYGNGDYCNNDYDYNSYNPPNRETKNDTYNKNNRLFIIAYMFFSICNFGTYIVNSCKSFASFVSFGK